MGKIKKITFKQLDAIAGNLLQCYIFIVHNLLNPDSI